MDPDQSLADLHTLVYVAQTIIDGGEVGDWKATLQAIVDTFNGLDDWIAMGGYLPDGWNVPRARKVNDDE